MVVFGAVPFAGFILHSSMLSNSRRVPSALFRRVIEMYPMLGDWKVSFVLIVCSISLIVVVAMHEVAMDMIAMVARLIKVAG